MAATIVDAADLPDRAGAGNLHQRRVVGVNGEFRRGNAPAEITHRAVVDKIGRAVRPELDRGGPINTPEHVRKRLVGVHRARRAPIGIMPLLVLRTIEREARHLQLVRIVLLGEVDQLDIVPEDRVAVLRRKAEIASRERSTAFFLTTPPTNPLGAKSRPTAATSAGSSASGATGCCGGNLRIGSTGLPTT